MNNASRTEIQTSALSTSVAVMVLLFVALIGIAMTSCESQSGHRNRAYTSIRAEGTTNQYEKCVILSDTTLTRGEGNDKLTTTRYRVKRIKQGVIDIIYEQGFPNFQAGDTILHSF